MLNEAGNVELALGNHAAASDHYEAAHAIRQEFNDPEGIALTTVQLGIVALREQKYAEAETRFSHSFEIYQEINDRGGLARSLEGLGRTAVATGHLRTACDHYQKALTIAVDIHYVPVILSLLEAVGEFLLELGEIEPGLRLLSRVASHPAGEYETRSQADQALERHQASVPEDAFQKAVKAGTEAELLALSESARADLTRLKEAADRRSSANTAQAGRTRPTSP
jgi:tetratricopeptide (TPR) repeat protein